MKEAFTLDREFLFKTNIYEITSISIEDNYDINGNNIEGEFIVSGDYRLHEISINKEDFSFKLPFKHEIKSNVNLDTINLDITDFTYNFNNSDELKIHVEYVINGEENIIEFDNQEKFDEYLDATDAEVISLKENEERNNLVLDEEMPKLNNEIESSIENIKEEIPVKDTINNNLFLNNDHFNEAYVKYHIHTVSMEDTIENICAKYNTNLNALKKYNNFETLELNMKLLIPENEES